MPPRRRRRPKTGPSNPPNTPTSTPSETQPPTTEVNPNVNNPNQNEVQTPPPTTSTLPISPGPTTPTPSYGSLLKLPREGSPSGSKSSDHHVRWSNKPPQIKAISPKASIDEDSEGLHPARKGGTASGSNPHFPALSSVISGLSQVADRVSQFSKGIGGNQRISIDKEPHHHHQGQGHHQGIPNTAVTSAWEEEEVPENHDQEENGQGHGLGHNLRKIFHHEHKRHYLPGANVHAPQTLVVTMDNELENRIGTYAKFVKQRTDEIPGDARVKQALKDEMKHLEETEDEWDLETKGLLEGFGVAWRNALALPHTKMKPRGTDIPQAATPDMTGHFGFCKRNCRRIGRFCCSTDGQQILGDDVVSQESIDKFNEQIDNGLRTPTPSTNTMIERASPKVEKLFEYDPNVPMRTEYLGIHEMEVHK